MSDEWSDENCQEADKNCHGQASSPKGFLVSWCLGSGFSDRFLIKGSMDDQFLSPSESWHIFCSKKSQGSVSLVSNVER